jgi:hypothetical protein
MANKETINDIKTTSRIMIFAPGGANSVSHIFRVEDIEPVKPSFLYKCITGEGTNTPCNYTLWFSRDAEGITLHYKYDQWDDIWTTKDFVTINL